MWVNEDGFIAVTAELSAVVETSIAVGPEGSFACTVSTATRISRARSRTCGPSSGLPRSAWRKSLQPQQFHLEVMATRDLRDGLCLRFGGGSIQWLYVPLTLQASARAVWKF